MERYARTAVITSVSFLIVALAGCSAGGSPLAAPTGGSSAAAAPAATPNAAAPAATPSAAAPPSAADAAAPTSASSVAATAAPSSCNAPPPPGASDGALAYLAAVDAATPAWQALSTTLANQGGMVHRDDLLAQVNADAPFLRALRQIRFPAEAAPSAAQLVLAIHAYDEFLTTAYNTQGYLASHAGEDDRLNETRAQSSARLRSVLGVQPSTCTYNRP